MSPYLHDTDYVIQIKQGLRSALLSLATLNASVQGEPHYTTDGKQLFISDGSIIQPVQSLDMSLVDMGDGNVVTDLATGTICYTF